jgi:nitrogen fixation protein NifU and related proteins
VSNGDELYQQVILDHNRSPRNFRKPEVSTHHAKGLNPFCGDEYDVFLTVDGAGCIVDVAFQGHGCAISKASASMMTQELRGKPVARARELIDAFQELLTGRHNSEKEPFNLGKLTVFQGVWQYPSRVKCAALCWHAVRSALDGATEASTEQSM